MKKNKTMSSSLWVATGPAAKAKAQHTPGPWENHKWNCEEHQISAKGGTIALVSHSHTLVSEAEADANARLIAAAPDLLAALRDVLAHTGMEIITEEDQIRWTSVLEDAKAAIAAAEGRTT
jgi:hypothetical protein